jgi:nitrite reductase (NADH) small subunit
MPTIRYLTSGCAVEFPDGDEVNMLRVAIRNECDVPYKCASGNCGTDRVRVVAGAENLSPPRKRERERLGELLDQGYRLCCQTYAGGDVTVEWDPDQKALDDRWVDKSLPSRADERLKRRWLSEADTAGRQAAEEDQAAVEARPGAAWVDAGSVAEVTKRRKLVLDHDDTPIVVIAHDGEFYAMDNICIHKERELVRGVVLGDRLVCPGHQWSFQLGTGWEAKMERCQPVYDVRVVDGRVEIDVDSRRVLSEPPCGDSLTRSG